MNRFDSSIAPIQLWRSITPRNGKLAILNADMAPLILS
jgi:hypothetical protein